jgi:hypothetical protein
MRNTLKQYKRQNMWAALEEGLLIFFDWRNSFGYLFEA